ncbi:4792_t:CDS:2, partial [Gigaspora margarita]
IKILQSRPKINNELDPKCTLTTIRHNCNRVTTDDWTKFSDDLIKKMEELQLHSLIIQDKDHLNKNWNT